MFIVSGRITKLWLKNRLGLFHSVTKEKRFGIDFCSSFFRAFNLDDAYIYADSAVSGVDSLALLIKICRNDGVLVSHYLTDSLYFERCLLLFICEVEKKGAQDNIICTMKRLWYTLIKFSWEFFGHRLKREGFPRRNRLYST